jgi:hypothetical protein
MNTINTLVQNVRESFLRNNADLLALTKNGADDVMRRVSAALALDQKLQDDVMIYADHLDQPNSYARGVSRADFQREMYAATCTAFLKVQHNYIIEFVAKLTPEAQAQLEDIEIAAGQREPRPVEPPPPPPKSAQELLDEQIRDDWAHLSSDKIKAKCRTNPAYKARLDQLMDELPTQCTSYTDGRNL